MEKRELKAGDIVQISPESKNEIFRGCLVIVSEPKSFGCQGYIQVPGEGQAYVRPTWDDIEFCGTAEWRI